MCRVGMISAPLGHGPVGVPRGDFLPQATKASYLRRHSADPLGSRQVGSGIYGCRCSRSPPRRAARVRPTHRREVIRCLGDTPGDTRCPFVSPRGHLRPHEHERPRRANPARALEYRRFQVRPAEDVSRPGKGTLCRAELLPVIRSFRLMATQRSACPPRSRSSASAPCTRPVASHPCEV